MAFIPRLCLILALMFAAAGRAEAQQRPVLVFAAASLSDVLQQIGPAYERQGGASRIQFSFAGSMTLAKQIEASSGADLFIAADRESMDYVAARGLIQDASRRDLLANRLVLIAPADSRVALTIAPGFPLARALGQGRLAVANPDSVPAGRYARAALTALGVWPAVAARLAPAEDVRQALAFVARGEAPLGIVYATDARAEPRVRTVAMFPESTHPPIRYPAALTREAQNAAAGFLRYLQGPAAAAVFARAGFTVLSAP